jgi:hypothetical protein
VHQLGDTSSRTIASLPRTRLPRTRVSKLEKKGQSGEADTASNARRAGDSPWIPRPSSKAMALPLGLPLGHFQERKEWPQMCLTPPPCLGAALDVLLNDKVALQDIQVWGLAVA